MSQRRGGINSGNYNSNINVTGGDMSQSSPPSKPYYRGGMSRGRGSFQQGPPRSGPMPVAPNHQPGMMNPGLGGIVLFNFIFIEISKKWRKFNKLNEIIALKTNEIDKQSF